MTAVHHKTVDALLETMPFIRSSQGTTVVIKYGGAAMTSQTLQEQFAEDVVILRLLGMKPVVVHGGGSQITRQLARLGIESRFIDGHRVTDAATMEVARMVLVGKINKDIVGLVGRHGGSAVGVSGEDAGLLKVTPRRHRDADGNEVDLGLVGDVAEVNVDLLELLTQSSIPVVASVGADAGGQAFNVNADTAAGEIAAALRAESIVFLTDVEGICEDHTSGAPPVAQCDLAHLGSLQEAGCISGGMVPKVAAVRRALEGGVGCARVVDGREEHAVLLALLTDAEHGSMVTR